MRYCTCRECKRKRREGKILGSRDMGFWTRNWKTGESEYYFGSVSDYVPFDKFKRKGSRRPVEKFRFDGATEC